MFSENWTHNLHFGEIECGFVFIFFFFYLNLRGLCLVRKTQQKTEHVHEISSETFTNIKTEALPIEPIYRDQTSRQQCQVGQLQLTTVVVDSRQQFCKLLAWSTAQVCTDYENHVVMHWRFLLLYTFIFSLIGNNLDYFKECTRLASDNCVAINRWFADG